MPRAARIRAVALQSMGDAGGAGAPGSPDESGPGSPEAALGAATQARNWRLVQADSIFIGLVNAAGTFLPVFLLRLGASANDVGLLTALPALTAFVLAIPFGRMLQARGRIVAWYSRLRLVAWTSYALIAGAVALLPREAAVPVALLIWALASLPSTAALVAFPMVMDGAAGPGGGSISWAAAGRSPGSRRSRPWRLVGSSWPPSRSR